ncbi:Uncharacterized protein Adt_48894 [Abeliophyllum distichum]|uniref:Uncharacterized protein n=1 Tax=Abeliophyllum distichum TaxID=126358 RepID=A0ABD1NPR5_9LAMI
MPHEGANLGTSWHQRGHIMSATWAHEGSMMAPTKAATSAHHCTRSQHDGSNFGTPWHTKAATQAGRHGTRRPQLRHTDTPAQAHGGSISGTRRQQLRHTDAATQAPTWAHKATLPLTIPRRVFKSSAKDSTRRSMEIVLQGGQRSTSAAMAWPTTCAPGGRKAPTCGSASGRRVYASLLARILT